jgi:hypothetical protein
LSKRKKENFCLCNGRVQLDRHTEFIAVLKKVRLAQLVI